MGCANSASVFRLTFLGPSFAFFAVAARDGSAEDTELGVKWLALSFEMKDRPSGQKCTLTSLERSRAPKYLQVLLLRYVGKPSP